MTSPDDNALHHRRTLSASSSLAAAAADDADADVPSAAAHLLDRERHPYHRRKSDLTHPTADPASVSSSTSLHASAATLVSTGSNGGSATSLAAKRATMLSPSESGTEADDEGSSAGLFFFKALPAPPFRPRKGLRGAPSAAVAADCRPGDDVTPLLTPTKLDGEVLRLSDVGIREPGPREPVLEEEHEEERMGRSKRVRRRRAEILRRLLEVGLMAGAGVAVLWKQGAWWVMNWGDRVAVISQVALLAIAFVAYPFRLVLYSRRESPVRRPVWRCVRVSAAFDPAPYIYPTILPVLTCLSLLPERKDALIPNLVLGLSAIPPHVFNLRSGPMSDLYPWIFSIIPAVLNDHWSGSIDLSRLSLYQPQRNHSSEMTASLYALHASLLPVLHFITATSLFPAELQLLSISLLNLLFLSRAPFSRILAIILWVGGLGILILCSPVIHWAVTLARVPRWRFRRAARIIQARQSFVRGLFDSVRRKRGPRKMSAPDIVPSDADDDLDESLATSNGIRLKPLNLEAIQSFTRNLFQADKDTVRSAVEWHGPDRFDQRNGTMKPEIRRRNTLPTSVIQATQDPQEKLKRRRTKGLPISYFISLTSEQAARRRWIYAGYLYLVIIILILGPIRSLVSRWALMGHEPFGWAIGYLGGDLRELRFWIVSSGFDGWIPLPPLRDACESSREASRFSRLCDDVVGPANTRLLITGYIAAILTLGLLTVQRLTHLVEVDTRRKVFHGMMVAMLLPTIPIDPPFLALALVLALSVFLLLDLLRASQLPPLSRPLAMFLAPFVDGRDLRGPVVISHIFLLVGCAVPLWLSLAAVPLGGDAPWVQWSTTPPAAPAAATATTSSGGVGRAGSGNGGDLSMVAGVACVGLGDAAASLVGRRFGRRKWAWSGGKSLEGSGAFALAVVAGLLSGKLEIMALLGRFSGLFGDGGLRAGGGLDGIGSVGVALLRWLGRAVAAAGAASLMEAVLTGGNDNVVVPVVLWLYVRAFGV